MSTKKVTKKGSLRDDYPRLDQLANPFFAKLDALRKERAAIIVEMWAVLRDEPLWGTWDTLDVAIDCGQREAKALTDAVMDVFDDHNNTFAELDAAEDVAARIIGNYHLRYRSQN